VFAGAVAGPDGFDLYLMSADGEELGPLSDEAGDEIEPDWSPDGSRIAFTFDDGGEPSWRSGIAVVNADGSGWTEVIARDQERVGMPHWSPDGSRLAFTVFSSDGITPYVIDADGSDLVRLRDGPGVVLDWTPDGRRILLSADERYVSVHPDGSDERVFIEDVPEAGRLVMDWSPDGAWIITSSPTAGPTQSGPAEGRVYLMRVDGSQVFVIALGAEPSWRPGTG
jgi:Tol biopolymer transport system component